jgi:hypothetical protein
VKVKPSPKASLAPASPRIASRAYPPAGLPERSNCDQPSGRSLAAARTARPGPNPPALTVTAEKPDRAAAIWRRVLGGSEPAAIEGGLRVTAACHVVDLLAPAAAARAVGLASLPTRPGIAAISFAVADLGLCRELLKRGGFAVREKVGA